MEKVYTCAVCGKEAINKINKYTGWVCDDCANGNINNQNSILVNSMSISKMIDLDNKTQKCPICGKHPTLDVKDMGLSRGRGYPGNTSATLRCGCKYFPKVNFNNVNYKKLGPLEVIEHCITLWNAEVNTLRLLIESNFNKSDTEYEDPQGEWK